MIHLITAENRHLYAAVMEQMHRARTDHFVRAAHGGEHGGGILREQKRSRG